MPPRTRRKLTTASPDSLAPIVVPDVSGLTAKEAAHKYLDGGLTPAPWAIRQSTKKLARRGSIREQAARASHADVDTWDSRWQCGCSVSPDTGLIAADLDVRDEFAEWVERDGIAVPRTALQHTGREGGRHLLFDARSLALEEWPTQGNIPGGQVKSNGFIAVEPSLHPSGKPYLWERRELVPMATLATAVAAYRRAQRPPGSGGGDRSDPERSAGALPGGGRLRAA